MSESSQPDETIFEDAVKLAPDQRAAYLKEACGNDAQLRQRVERLLQAHDQTGGVLEKPPAAVSAKTFVITTDMVPVTEKAGDRIGRYKLLQQIGEGGCGVVYMAEQEEPVRRRVALKVIKLGMDTKSVVARFEAERQALALMDHPNIAKVLDAGATETGRPFFVMELVRGVKITDYCDEAKLSTGQRLDLFIQVCHAIQHAHQKGIIHRDLKPSNILVTINDGVPVPKVIDFGIAKATTDQRLTDKTLFTAFEQFIGTPAYMSPEQAVMTSLDIDTRSDIYALGVLLYELLTGKTPFDPKELLQSGFDEMRRTIREKEPERPSTRLSTMLDADLTVVAQRRHSEAPRLINLLRGDLDWIVMKALEKDRTRRFETANGLAMDIQRYLNNEPVTARPPSSMYRFQKLVRRNKTAFAGVGAVAAALVIGLGLSLYLYIRERHARQRAVAAEQEQNRMRQQAEIRGEIGRKLTQAGLLISRDQYAEAEKIAMQVSDPAGASILNVLGILHGRRGEWQEAAADFERVVELIPTDHDAYHSLAPLLAQSDPGAYRRLRVQMLAAFARTSEPAIAERMARDCMILSPPATDLETIGKMVDAAIAAGPNHQFWDYFQFVKGLYEYRNGRFASTVEWLQKVVPRESDPNRTVEAYMVLAMAQHQLKQVDEARATLGKGLKIADAKLSKPGSPQFNDQIAAQMLVREARALIEHGAGTDTKP
ncbi:MAG TPA: protein kinase [Candidatus Angelobacter sp.]|nr:protein kinase [Candidatus Angelobacter sp.]